MLRQVHEIMPKIYQETGVMIRFLAAIRRIPLTIVKDAITPSDYLEQNLEVLKATALDPYVAGCDFVGEEINDIITLKPAYLETLSVGVHSLTAMFTDGEVSTPFIVVQPGSGSERYDYPETVYVLPSNNPRTGDDSSIMLWGTLALISALAAGSSYTLLRRRRKKTS